MSLGGTYQDHYKDMFKETLLLEAQQMGSRLEQSVMIESMSGNKTYFDKLGKVTNYIKSSRGQAKNLSDITFERRQVQEEFAEFDHLIDREDLIKYVQDPKSEVVQSAVAELGRRKDLVIHNALAGNAVVTTDGSSANQALTLSVAVDNHDFDSGSGDVALTSGKLKKAVSLILANHGASSNERLICVAPIDQIMNLSTESEQISGDFRATKALDGPGIVKGLSGYMGIDFIAYDEQILVDGSADERIFLYSESAIKLGIFEPLKVEIDRAVERAGNPDILSVFEAIGATRMYEEKVVEILCNPIA
jgi:hypothetical protein